MAGSKHEHVAEKRQSVRIGTLSNNQSIAALITTFGTIAAAAFFGGARAATVLNIGGTPRPAVTVTVTSPVSAGTSPGPSAPAPSPSHSSVRYAGYVLITLNGMNYTTEPPSSPNAYGPAWESNDARLLSEANTVAAWNGTGTPTETQCRDQTDTEAYPQYYAWTNPPVGLGFCMATFGSPTYEVFVRIISINVAVGVQTYSIVWPAIYN
jgi:hypothetical protein